MPDGCIPQVSVIMAVYNGEKYLNEAVDSILNQTFGDFELIITDDGSTDDTPRILAEYAKADERVRILTNPAPTGRGAARNLAIAQVRADLLAVQDADDFSLPQRLELHVAYMRQHSDVGAVASGFCWVDRDGRFVAPIPFHFMGEDLPERMPLGCSYAHWAAMFRSDAIRAIGGYRPGFIAAQDTDMLYRFMERFSVGVLDVPVICYRQVTGSVSYAGRAVQAQCGDLAREFARQREINGTDEYEAYVRDGRMPRLEGPRQDVEDASYYWDLTKTAHQYMAIRPMLRYAVRAVREKMTLLPQATVLVGGGLLRLALNRLGIAAWLRVLRGLPANSNKMHRPDEYYRVWRQYRDWLEQCGRAAIDEESLRRATQQGE